MTDLEKAIFVLFKTKMKMCQEICKGCGDTPKEAMQNIREAIDLYLKNAEEYGMLDDINAAITSREKFTAVIEV